MHPPQLFLAAHPAFIKVHNRRTADLIANLCLDVFERQTGTLDHVTERSGSQRKSEELLKKTRGALHWKQLPLRAINRQSVDAGSILRGLCHTLRKRRAIFPIATRTDFDLALVLGDDWLQGRKIKHLPTFQVIRRLPAQILPAPLARLYGMRLRVIRMRDRFKSRSNMIFLSAGLFSGHAPQTARARNLLQTILGGWQA